MDDRGWSPEDVGSGRTGLRGMRWSGEVGPVEDDSEVHSSSYGGGVPSERTVGSDPDSLWECHRRK